MHAERLTHADIPLYIDIRRRMLADSPVAFLPSPSEDRNLDPEYLAQAMASGDPAIFGIREHDRLLASARVTRQPLAKRAHVALIMGVFVDPAARGRGMGECIINACVQHARTLGGVTQVQLSVSSGSPAAQRLYQRLGFVAWGTEREATRVDGCWYDEIHMVLRL